MNVNIFTLTMPKTVFNQFFFLKSKKLENEILPLRIEIIFLLEMVFLVTI